MNMEETMRDIRRKNLPTRQELVAEVVVNALITNDFERTFDNYIAVHEPRVNDVYGTSDYPCMDFKLDCAEEYITKVERWRSLK